MSYISKLFTTGAIRKTPARVINQILNQVKGNDLTIIEFGAGKGEITSAILNDPNRKINKYVAFELDSSACKELIANCPSATIVNEDAFNFSNALEDGLLADYIICSIPISFYPRKKVTLFLNKMHGTLKPGGKIIVVFSALWMVHFFKKYSSSGKIKAFFTFPPYFLFFDPA